MKQRLGIAQAILGCPQLILLDEPTNAIDAGGIQLVKALVKDLKTQGSTLILTSHDRMFLEELADEVITMEGGVWYAGSKKAKALVLHLSGGGIAMYNNFFVCYNRINDPKHAFQIEKETISFGEEFEVSGIMVKVQKPRIQNYYDKEYSADVCRYIVPFTAVNLEEEVQPLFPVENLQIVSAGRTWYGWPEDSYEKKENKKTNWETLVPGETTKGTWVIDVVKEDLPDDRYENWKLYYLQDEGQYLFEFQFV